MQDEMMKWRLKMAAAVVIDIADFFIRVPILGSGAELVFTGLGLALWGNSGWLMAAELLDPTDQLDGFVPTCCIIGWRCKPAVPTPSPVESGIPVPILAA